MVYTYYEILLDISNEIDANTTIWVNHKNIILAKIKKYIYTSVASRQISMHVHTAEMQSNKNRYTSKSFKMLPISGRKV